MGSDRQRVIVYSLALCLGFLLAWHLLASPPGSGGKSKGLPGPLAVGATAWEMLSNPFYDNGPNDKGIGIQLLSSLGRLSIGYVAAALVAILLGILLGLSPTLYRAFNPYIQVLKPISPLAWMPLFLYTIKNGASAAVLVVFMSSLWPTLANTAFGVSNIRRDYLHVARLLAAFVAGAARPRRPARGRTRHRGRPAYLHGRAWIAIVAAEMLIGGTGMGYFVWNEWNNLQLTSVIFAIITIGLVGVLLDYGLGRLSRSVAFAD